MFGPVGRIGLRYRGERHIGEQGFEFVPLPTTEDESDDQTEDESDDQTEDVSDDQTQDPHQADIRYFPQWYYYIKSKTLEVNQDTDFRVIEIEEDDTPYNVYDKLSLKNTKKPDYRVFYSYEAGFAAVCHNAYIDQKPQDTNDLIQPPSETRLKLNCNYNRHRSGAPQPNYANIGMLESCILNHQTLDFDDAELLAVHGQAAPYHHYELQLIRLVWCQQAVKRASNSEMPPQSDHIVYNMIEHMKGRVTDNKTLVDLNEMQSILARLIQRNSERICDVLSANEGNLDIIYISLRLPTKHVTAQNTTQAATQQTYHIFSWILAQQQAQDPEFDSDVKPISTRADGLKESIIRNPETYGSIITYEHDDEPSRFLYTGTFANMIWSSIERLYRHTIDKRLLTWVSCYLALVFFLAFSSNMLLAFIVACSFEYGSKFRHENFHGINFDILNNLYTQVSNIENALLNKLANMSMHNTIIDACIITIVTGLIYFALSLATVFTMSLSPSLTTSCLTLIAAIFAYDSLIDASTDHPINSIINHAGMLIMQIGCVFMYGLSPGGVFLYSPIVGTLLTTFMGYMVNVGVQGKVPADYNPISWDELIKTGTIHKDYHYEQCYIASKRLIDYRIEAHENRKHYIFNALSRIRQ